MTTTTNFGFTIPDGTDNVNLLTQNYPNWTNLDAILKAIKDTGITAATATKTGTNFAVVRSDADCKYFGFVALSNYDAGDTFTVDGVPVTATTPAGTSLPQGAFVINQCVLACLNGAVLTVYVSAGATTMDADDVNYDNSGSGLTATDVQAAIDELKADIPVVPASYAASAITYDNTVSGLTAIDVQNAIDELNTKFPWKKVGTYANNVPATLPANYTELLFIVNLGASAQVCSQVLPKQEMDGALTDKLLMVGYGATGATYAQINYNNTSCVLFASFIGGQNYTTSASLDLYYR